MRYRLRTLLILVGVLPPLLGGIYWAVKLQPMAVIFVVWIVVSIFGVVACWRAIDSLW
jgi:hypothetical protein